MRKIRPTTGMYIKEVRTMESRYEDPIPTETKVIGWVMVGICIVLAVLISIKYKYIDYTIFF